MPSDAKRSIRARGAKPPVDVLLKEAADRYERGDLDGAEATLQRALVRSAGHPDALHLGGLVLLARGDARAARDRIARAVAKSPTTATYRLGLGTALARMGEADAVAELARALSLAPSMSAHVYNLGVDLEDAGDPDGAKACYELAASGAAPIPEASFNLGNLLTARGSLEDAILAYQRATTLRPGYARALANLGSVLHRAQRWEEAADALRHVLEVDPTDAQARHLLAALRGERVTTADPSYVSEFFDAYANGFEAVLVDKLGYDVPAALGRLAAAHGAGSFARAMDLGCGTGLVGRAVRPLCETLVGVDLSPNMIERATASGAYDELVVGEIVEVLREREDRFDLFLAADVLIYLGDPQPLFAAVRARCEVGALFVFSIETSASEPGAGYLLERTGRFSHAPEHVHSAACAAGFDVEARETHALREEVGAPVPGALFALCATSR